MNEANVNPVPVPQPEESGSSVSNTSDVRGEASMHTPQVKPRDLLNIAHKLRYDLDSARAKLVELTAYIVALNLPTEAQPFSEAKGLAFVRNTAHEYTDSSLADELALMGADREFIDRALLVAAEVRRESVPA
jgi:hypothetical protein